MSGRPLALHGQGVGRGAAFGPVVRSHPAPSAPDAATPAASIQDPEKAAESVEAAYAAVAQRLTAQAASAAGTTLGDVLSAAAAMAADPELIADAVARVRQGAHPSIAVDAATQEYVELFSAAGGYLAERVTDLRSVRDRVIAELMGLPEPGVPTFEAPSILIAVDLSPADTATLDMEKVLAIVLEEGGVTGHTAIIAGQLGIPCVVRVDGVSSLQPGDMVAVDAAEGTVVRDPDEATRAEVAARREMLATLAGNVDPGRTADGHRVELLANIGTADDAERLAKREVEGVGLFRTEVLFLGRQTAPDQVEQADVYERVLRARGGQKVVVRTLDAGADKPLAFVRRATEENPALGVRGYRLTRTMPELLAEQLDALADAQSRTGIAVWAMAPMIATAHEAAEFAIHARSRGLERAGVMIEVPAAALRVDEILAAVDFVSIGTNDLAQYTMAADRLVGDLSDLLDAWQPAVLDLVAMVLRAAEAHGKPAGVCGESAADPLMALVLTGLGATSLSMSPAAIPAARFALAAHSRARCQQIAAAALDAATATEARAAAVALCDPEVALALSLG
ncbi:Phosphoenolpyruvate-protein phosphotransferase [Microbacterium sp. 8M]|uniref:phosphoenolpyruvate--protein phosphotransferase n=1 Tax=Microbacterium sp. 8M TaxID=2653153 RepID=UPI0012F0C6F6|nr:phosphoenolpyruvate--protein phosphotransferase [Microbacterium sp. 8M]VXC02300.1 Phosphoenolpyruvate-protein phosphotransferase [Microbacterium sp. 8M]